MSYILPATEWANDAMRPALVTILRRLDKVFQKISKKPSIRVGVDGVLLWSCKVKVKIKILYQSRYTYLY